MRCFNCMEEITGKTCLKCGCDMDPKPFKDYHLPPGTELNGRYILGYCRKQTPVYIAYIAWDKEEEKTVYIDEYFPKKLSLRESDGKNVGPLNVDTENAFTSGYKAFKDETVDLAITDDVDVIAGFEENRTFYSVRKIMNGLNIAALMTGEYDLTDDYAKRILILTLRALHKVNKMGIIHGNIKPETVYFNEDTSVTLAEFSYCGYMSRVINVDCNDGYSPVEQYIKGSKLKVNVDVYSAAALFYKLLTEDVPPKATLRQEYDSLVAPSEKGIKMRKGMENALLNALNVNSEYRTPTVNDFYAQLKDKNTKRVEEEKQETDESDSLPLVAKMIEEPSEKEEGKKEEEEKAVPEEIVVKPEEDDEPYTEPEDEPEEEEEKGVSFLKIFIIVFLIFLFLAAAAIGAVWYIHNNNVKKATLNLTGEETTVVEEEPQTNEQGEILSEGETQLEDATLAEGPTESTTKYNSAIKPLTPGELEKMKRNQAEALTEKPVETTTAAPKVSPVPIVPVLPSVTDNISTGTAVR
ncbi:MAG: hypothetical protein IJS61_05055 [Firmicutes bacterium]|nr:hypothetical protein [Bacillota bacterium]